VLCLKFVTYRKSFGAITGKRHQLVDRAREVVG